MNEFSRYNQIWFVFCCFADLTMHCHKACCCLHSTNLDKQLSRQSLFFSHRTVSVSHNRRGWNMNNKSFNHSTILHPTKLHCTPAYISYLLSLHSTSRTLRSSDHSLLSVWCSQSKSRGNKTFSFAPLRLWTSSLVVLPDLLPLYNSSPKCSKLHYYCCFIAVIYFF